MSCPFSIRVSGSAFMSQYCLPVGSSVGVFVASGADLTVVCSQVIHWSAWFLGSSCFILLYFTNWQQAYRFVLGGIAIDSQWLWLLLFGSCFLLGLRYF